MQTGDIGSIHIDPASERRQTIVARRVLAAVLAIVVLATALSAFQLRRIALDAERDAELAFVALVGLAPPSSRSELLDAAGRTGFVIGDDGEITPIASTAPLPDDTRWSRWRNQTRLRLASSDERVIALADPDGNGWWHTAAATWDGERLVVSRPASSAEALAIRSVIPAVVLGGIAALMALVVWMLFRRRVLTPVTALTDAAEQLVVRGHILDHERRRLDAVHPTPFELRRLADLLTKLHHDTTRRSRQDETLLGAAAALGRSLDPEEVLASTLDHLELLIGAERSAIVRFEARTAHFDVVAIRGHAATYIDEMSTRHHDATLPSMRALRERQPVQVSDTESEVVAQSLRKRGRRHGYRSVLAIPLTNELEKPTVLLLHASQPRTYSYDEVQLCRSFASIAGAALRNSELFARTDDELRAESSRLESIVESVDQGLVVESESGDLLFANSTIRSMLVGSDPEPMTTADLLRSLLRGARDPERTLHELNELDPAGARWADVDLTDPVGVARSFRVRRFVVRDRHGDVTGRGQVWTDVSRDRQLERMKEGLLAAVSHEFRTPLALIKGYATTLLSEDVTWSPTEQREFLELVSGEADRLTELVKSLLDMRRIDAGMIELERMPARLPSLLDAAIGGVHQADRIEIVEAPDLLIECDASRIVTALRNLLENACEHSPAGSTVSLTCTRTADELTISVRDRGRGVDPAVADRIFDTFVRGETGLTAEHGGVGLGLSIAQGFTEAHGGRVTSSDPSDGPGAVFTISLPAETIVIEPADLTWSRPS